jgi:ABC-type transport system involved in multi-copper enzyme maturation permease subunit
MTGLVASAFGGAAFAQERRERSADFLAMLPVTRGKIVASKVIVSLGWPALVWLANLLVMWIASSIAPGAEMSRVSLQDGLWRAVGASATTGLMMFGVAWMFSSFLKSPTIAAVISMGMTVSLLMVLALISQRSGRNGREDEQWLDWLVMLSTFCFGILGLALGSVYYLARIEP